MLGNPFATPARPPDEPKSESYPICENCGRDWHGLPDTICGFPASRWHPRPHPLPVARGYQPEWVDGREVGVGLRECDSRYVAIKRYLVERMGRTGAPQLHEPTVLDLGAYNGYFCRRLHDDFGARCTAVDNCPRLTESPGVTVIPRLLNPDAIRALGHFDVALCLSVLHHHGDWMDYITALREVADLCFIETANPNEHLGLYRGYGEGAHRELSRIGTVIAETPPMHGPHLRPLWVVDSSNLVTKELRDDGSIWVDGQIMVRGPTSGPAPP